MILDEIVARTRADLDQKRRLKPVAVLKAMAADAPKPRDFGAALKKPGLSVIAEVKKT
ncbi:hypothetical protein ACFLWF_02160 [Chloroflexota bacterium]